MVFLMVCILMVACNQEKVKVKSVVTKKIDHQLKPITNKDSSNSRIPRSVETIKERYANTIKKLQNGLLDSLTLTYNCYNERSGTLVYFSENGKLLMIKHQYAEYDHFSAKDEYFVMDNKLYFAYLNSLTWSFDSKGDVEGGTKDDILEHRIYIVDNDPIQCLEKKFTVYSYVKNNPQSAQIANKQVKCRPIASLLIDFNKLLAFRNKPKDCLEK